MRALLLLAWLAAGARAQEQNTGAPQVFSIPKHNGGLATFYSGDRLTDGQSPNILNGYLDVDAAVVKRNGYQVYGTIGGCTGIVTGGWPYTNLNGTYYFFVQCGNQVYETKGDGVFSVIGGTISTVNATRAVATLGYEYFVDGIDQLWYTDGVTVSSVATAPYAKLVDTFQNRLVLSNITGGPVGQGFTAGQSNTWLGGYQSGTDFTLPAIIVDTSAASFPLNGSNDTRQVNCVFGGFKNVLVLWNDSQMWGLYGSGNSSFALTLISNEIGCVEQGSVQEYNGHLYWLSKRGIEDFDGTTVNLVSWPIQDLAQNLISLKKTSVQNIQKSQADWQAGNITASGPGAPLSATLAPGNVVPSSWSVIETDGSHWNTATMVNVSTAVGYPVFAQGSTAAFTNAGGESNSTTINWPGGISPTTPCQSQSNMGISATGVAIFGSYAWKSCTFSNSTGSNVTFSVLDPNSNVLVSSTVYVPRALSQTIFTLDTSTLPFSTVKLRFSGSDSLGSLWRSTDSVAFVRGSGIRLGYANACTNACSLPYWDVDESAMVTTGTYTTTLYDTSFSTPTWSPFTVTVSSPANSTLTMQVQVATAATGVLTAQLAQTPGSQISAVADRYITTVASFSVNSTTNTPPYFQGLSLAAETTGYFITQCVQPTGITSWGAFQSDNLPNGGSFTYWMSTATTCASATNPATNWTAQTLNTTITVATAAAVAVRVLESMSVSTQVPRLQDITLNYNTGSGRPALVSTVYNKRYYLGFSTNTATAAYNDHFLVFDTNRTWTLLDDIFASSVFTSNLKLYTGSSKSDGNVFLQDTGSVDNGVAFTFQLDTPDEDFGNFAQTKDLADWWTQAQGVTVNTNASNVAVSYLVDGGTTAYSAGTFSTFAPERGYLYAHGTFALGANPTRIRTVRLRYSDTSASPLRVYETNLRYWGESLP